MQDLFLVRDGQAILQCNGKMYIDTKDSFIADGGIIIDGDIDYNKATKSYILNEELDRYPNNTIEQNFTNIDSIIAAKEIRIAPPEPTLEELKANKLSELDTFIADKITGGFTSECTGTAVKYDSDTDTQITMQGIALNADSIAAKYPTGVPVRGYVAGAAEKTVQYLSGVQLLAWCADLSLHIGACKQLGWQKQAEINAAETKEALEAIIF